MVRSGQTGVENDPMNQGETSIKLIEIIMEEKLRVIISGGP